MLSLKVVQYLYFRQNRILIYELNVIYPNLYFQLQNLRCIVAETSICRPFYKKFTKDKFILRTIRLEKYM